MKKAPAILAALSALGLSSAAMAAMDPYVEYALIDTCKAIASNQPLKLNAAVREYNLSYRLIADKLVCNGRDVVDWADYNEADRNVAHLQHKIGGRVTITDLAANQNQRWQVQFD